MRDSVSQTAAKADAAVEKANQAASSTNMAKRLDDYMHPGSHTIAFSWNGEKLLVVVDGNNVRSW